jgi:LA2681-like HEPN
MARGNRGGGRLTYARALYDRGHADVFVLLAQSDLAAAVELAARHPVLGHEAASESYHARATDLASRFDLVSIGATFNPDGHALGRSNDERRYRSWCLENQLYLNPPNDLGAHSIAARDVLTLPTFVTSLSDPSPPPLIGFYNQLKLEFVSARWLYYEGMLAGRPHFSDRNVLLPRVIQNEGKAASV